MKKIVLSTLAALSIASVASAADVKLYSDDNGQVFTKPAEGRTEIKSSTSVFSKTDRLDFSMLAYIGFVNNDYRVNTPTRVDSADFEARRMYFQMKAHLLDDPKSYLRVTYDVHKPQADDNYYDANVKYLYLYLNDILPYTGIEIGQAHTTLLDYEEGHSWAYRSIDNVFTEQPNGPKLNASAGRGIDIKTNTTWFSSEIGVYNGEGYHTAQPTDAGGMGFDYEGRFTLHALGTGTDYKTDHTYWDVSLLAKDNIAKAGGDDMTFFGVHSVFNTKPLLVAAQYISSLDTKTGSTTNVSKYSGSGYSVNFDARMGEKSQYHLFGRYDIWTPKTDDGFKKLDKRTYIGGVAWDMNKNIQWVANVIVQDNQAGTTQIDGSTVTNHTDNGNKYMMTAQVSF